MNKPHPHHFLLRAEYTLTDWWREKQERLMRENECYRPRAPERVVMRPKYSGET
jgi:hypothetical protein